MADVKPNTPRVVWESEVETTGNRLRIVETERFGYDGSLAKSYTVEHARERDAMGQWRWEEMPLSDCGGGEYEAGKVLVAALGSRCGCEGEKAEVPE